MEAVVPWDALITLIEPHYPKTRKEGGRPPYPLATMLQIHLLEKQGLDEQIFQTVIAHLSARGMSMRQGTIVNATLIASPSSTKNKWGSGIRR
jgi:IS5 family transposase